MNFMIYRFWDKPILLKRDIKHKKCFFIVTTRYRNKERTADFNQIVKIHSYQISTFLDHTYYTVYAGVFLHITKFVKMGKMSNTFVCDSHFLQFKKKFAENFTGFNFCAFINM